jgi:F-type H+-transporting ATPase subunit gamma
MAESTRDIRRRIKSVRSTQQITGAMKMVAASKLRKAQNRLMAVRPYDELIGRQLRTVLSRLVGDEHPLLSRRPGNRLALIIITSDKGLAGAYNHNIVRAAEALLKSHDGGQLCVVGKKGAHTLRRAGHEIKYAYTGLSENATFGQAAEIMRQHVRDYMAGEFDQLQVVYSYFRSAISQQPRSELLLPLAPPSDDEKSDRGPTEEFLMEPSTEEVVAALLEEWLDVKLFRAMMESATSEHGARMTSMENATKNAEEMISDLTLIYNRARQAMITREIAEIVGGAEALSER